MPPVQSFNFAALRGSQTLSGTVIRTITVITTEPLLCVRPGAKHTLHFVSSPQQHEKLGTTVYFIRRES